METSDFNIRHPDRVRSILEEDRPPGWFERLGLRYFQGLSERDPGTAAGATTDQEMRARVRAATVWGFVIALLIGGVSAGGSVWVETMFPDDACAVLLSRPCLTKYGTVALATIVLTTIEFAVLFGVSLRVVYAVACATGHSRLDPEDLFSLPVPLLLARAALEIPDPVRKILGIDPLRKVSRRRLLAVGIIYKVKVIMSNVVAKLALRRVLGKSAVRVSADYISVLVTGLWNGVVVWKVAREARLRLVGNLLARHIALREFTPEKLAMLSNRAKLCCLQAVGNSIVLTQNYHPNMLVLLARLYEIIDLEPGNSLDDWDDFMANLDGVREAERYFVLDLLAVAAAFDGKISKLERVTLGQAFQEHTGTYFARIERLKTLLRQGRMFGAIEECHLDFEAG